MLLRWPLNDPMEMLQVITDSPWQMLDKSKKIKTIKSATYVPAKGSISVKHVLDEDKETLQVKKKRKTSKSNNDSLESPLGLQWDNDNYSCSYDALFGILYNIWVLDPETSARTQATANLFSGALAESATSLQVEQVCVIHTYNQLAIT